ncbi:MAG: hypothetical protein WKF32_05765 [Thermoleophilaceae bacterium]
MRALVVLLAAATVAAGCGADDEPSGSPAKGGAEVETTESGTKIIASTDEKAGMRVEVQDDSLYVTLTDDAPQATRDLEGQGIGGSCDDDGGGGVEAAAEFPILWREDPGDWGSALSRANAETGVTTVEEDEYEDFEKAEEAKPRLAEHVTRCRLFAPGADGGFDSESDDPIATFEFRESP